MIFIERNRKNLDFVKTKGFKSKLEKEFEKAEKFHVGGDKSIKLEFNCYKDGYIKAELISMFNGKCAYCDSTLVHITHGDIEHFRPKSKYWWLAADWNNLLFACEKCNRTGKNDAFPLNKDIAHCTYDDKDLYKDNESDRLLINPCIEKPEDFFEYDEKEAIIKAKKTITINSKEFEMISKSIETYQLQRIELVQEREKVLILLKVQISYAIKAIEKYQKMRKCPPAIRAKIENKIEENLKSELKKLLEFNSPKRQYLGMIRQVLRNFYDEFGLPLPKGLQPQ